MIDLFLQFIRSTQEYFGPIPWSLATVESSLAKTQRTQSPGLKVATATK
jgi:hypothetical protein